MTDALNTLRRFHGHTRTQIVFNPNEYILKIFSLTDKYS